MIKKFLVLISFVLLSATVIAKAVPKNHKIALESQIKSETRVLQSFNQVTISGFINVRLHTGTAQSKVVLRGDPRDLIAIKTQVNKKGIMFLSFSGAKVNYAPVSVDVYTKNLNVFNYKGHGNIDGHRIKSNLLDVAIDNGGLTRLDGDLNIRKLRLKGRGYTEINGVKSKALYVFTEGSPQIQLNGIAELSLLDMQGSGHFSLYWLNSNALRVRGKGQVSILLAGVANHLEVELWGKAHFNGRYLNAKRVFAKTHGSSLAEIRASRRQHTLASENSNIYFYKEPDIKTDFMAFNGAVLDMRDWNSQYRDIIRSSSQ